MPIVLESKPLEIEPIFISGQMTLPLSPSVWLSTTVKCANPFFSQRNKILRSGLHFARSPARPGGTSTGTLECKVSGSSGNSTSTLASNVAFGIYYYLRIEVKDAQSRCGIYSNSVWVYTPYATGPPGKMYYKTGNYTQPTQGTEGLAGRTRVRVKNFSVVH